MTYLTRGPGRMPGIGSKGHASNEPTPVGCASQYRYGGEGMTYLTRGPGRGKTASPFAITATASSLSTTTPQAAP